MPNLKGGKKYRSGKHTETKYEFHEISEGQSVGRVLKHLGDRNVLLYCNDGKERIAHIRGGLSKKKATINIGDIVLYSNRGDELGSASGSSVRGDVLAKYQDETHHELKRLAGINPRLFVQIENADATALNRNAAIDEAFEFDVGSDSGSESESPDEEKRTLKKLQEDLKRSTARDNKYAGADGDRDVNVDDI